MKRGLNNAMRQITTFGIGLLLYAVALPAYGATITVTNTNDSGPGSLRQALAVAHDGDRITFAVSGTITLNSGGLGVFKNVTISGPGADQLSIDGNQSPTQPVFSVLAIATISGLTIRNGADGIDNFGGTLTVRNCVISGNSIAGINNYTQEFGTVTATILSTTVSGNSQGGVVTAPNIFSGGATVTITDCTISGNFSAPGGGGIFGAHTSLSVANSTISGNSTGRSGGGILVVNSLASIVNSTISGNSAETSGGGIYGGATVENSTISGNSAGMSGGGIYGSATVENSTISGNSAGTSGGGIYNNSSLYVTLSTISGNSAPSGGGGGIYNDAVVEISNTILNAGALGENIFNNGGTVTSDGYNLSSDDGGGYLTGPGDQINTDPLLGPLQDNGGPTFTHALLPGSPAIDAGDPNFSPPPSHDQRDCHFDRVFNGRIDIGSFETQPPRRPCPTPRPRPTPPPRP
jgi:predicted outer membrane repeat protein